MSQLKYTPPSLAMRFFRWFCHPKMRGYIEGDLMEVYERRVKKFSKRKADWLFVLDVLLLFRPGIIRPAEGIKNVNTYGMYKNYLIIGWRSLLRSKGYSIINISGLALGMAVAMLIGLWVHYETTFNQTFENYSRIGMVYHNLSLGGEIISYEGAPVPYSSELKSNFSEFKEATTCLGPRELVVGSEDKKFSRQCYFVDPSFFKVFSVRMKEGTAESLKNPRSVLLAQALAEEIVGKDAIGKMVKLNNLDEMLVAGVFEDFPINSFFSETKILASAEYYFSQNEGTRKQRDSWGNLESACFVLLADGITWEQADAKIKTFLFDRTTEAVQGIKPEGFFHPMERWHLYSEFKDGKNVAGAVRFVWMFGTVGVFVLLLACINFMNLSTARSEKRSKEVGVRKVMGSLRSQLINQFMSESMLVVFIAFVFSIGIVLVCLPSFNQLAEVQLEMPWSNPYFFGASLTFVFITALLAGSYPALYLSSFSPVKVLKGTFKMGRSASLPRKALVIFQFAISTILIIGTGIVYQQVQHAKERPVGFDTENIIHIEVKTNDLASADFNSVRNTLLETGVVENVAKSDFPITGSMSAEGTITWQGKDPTKESLIALNQCSHDFPSTNGFQFVEGRDFSREFVSDSMALIVNEMAAALFAPGESAIGKTISWGENDYQIIGVIKDQIRWSPFQKQSPHIYYINYSDKGFYTVRIKAGAEAHNGVMKIESVFRKFDPGTPFDYKFLDEDYARLFKSEERTAALTSVFAGLAMLISCIGIFGLASFAASQRTKEIGIRKVLGASVFRLWKMLSKDFAWLMTIAIVISFPVAYYFANDWLSQYEYRIAIDWPIFIITAATLFVLTLFTVSYQSIKAALANPVDSLRSE